MERTGKIVKGIGGFYYVDCEADGSSRQYECKAKGLFRKDKVKPLVGDDVRIQVISDEQQWGNIEEILLDRFLVMMGRQGIETAICFNKLDIVPEDEEERLRQVYEKCANEVLFVSSKERIGLEGLRRRLEGRTTVLAGPSGVGKSSILNEIYPQASSKTGAVSEKIGRGRHTTRHSELFCIGKRTYLFDTPGFSSLRMPDMEKEELRHYFTEFAPYEGQCRFMGCSHTHEPGCKVKEALEQGLLNPVRYENYVQLFGELKEWEERKYT